jgi:hypothetical protein
MLLQQQFRIGNSSCDTCLIMTANFLVICRCLLECFGCPVSDEIDSAIDCFFCAVLR